jgi:hypothetical protein
MAAVNGGVWSEFCNAESAVCKACRIISMQYGDNAAKDHIIRAAYVNRAEEEGGLNVGVVRLWIPPTSDFGAIPDWMAGWDVKRKGAVVQVVFCSGKEVPPCGWCQVGMSHADFDSFYPSLQTLKEWRRSTRTPKQTSTGLHPTLPLANLGWFEEVPGVERKYIDRREWVQHSPWAAICKMRLSDQNDLTA